jgi:hypothetical protein
MQESAPVPMRPAGVSAAMPFRISAGLVAATRGVGVEERGVDYVAVNPKPDAATVLKSLPIWFNT